MSNKNENPAGQRLVERFLALLRIASPSRQEGRLAAHLKGELEALGFTVEFDSAGERAGSDTGNLIATLPATAAGVEPMIFCCHLDTVTPCADVRPQIAGGVVRSDGTTILGGDDKAGIAAVVEGVQRIRERGVAHGVIQVLLTICEEVGMHGAKELDYGKLKGKRVFVLDGEGAPGKIVVQGPAKDLVRATVRGRTAHAGLCPERGVSAIQVAARAIELMHLLRIDEETTANIGSIHGGTATNVVAEEVVVVAEARSLDNARLDAQSAHMKACFEDAARDFGATAEVVVERSYAAFLLDADNPVVGHCMAAMRRLGLTPELVATGGGSDCNIFNARGLTAVDLSIGMTDPHATSESLRLVDLETTARLVEAIIENCA